MQRSKSQKNLSESHLHVPLVREQSNEHEHRNEDSESHEEHHHFGEHAHLQVLSRVFELCYALIRPVDAFVLLL